MFSNSLYSQNDSIEIGVNNVINSLQTGDVRQRLGGVDAIHDYLVYLGNSAMSSESYNILKQVAIVMTDVIGTLKKSDPMRLIGPVIDPVHAKIKEMLKTSSVPDESPEMSQIPPELAFNQELGFALTMAGTGDRNALAALKKQVQANPNWAPYWNQAQKDSEELQALGSLGESMMSFSNWRYFIKETDAIYDGTPAKDGGGFNWWGAVGKPGGTSINRRAYQERT